VSNATGADYGSTRREQARRVVMHQMANAAAAKDQE